MTPKKQRIAIAEACGIIAQYNKIYGWIDQIGCAIPDYLNDLNACHEFECSLDSKTFDKYASRLISEVIGWDSYKKEYIAIKATAAQRCEAFLRTLDLWDNNKP